MAAFICFGFCFLSFVVFVCLRHGLTAYLRLILNSPSSCLSFLNPGDYKTEPPCSAQVGNGLTKQEVWFREVWSESIQSWDSAVSLQGKGRRSCCCCSLLARFFHPSLSSCRPACISSGPDPRGSRGSASVRWPRRQGRCSICSRPRMCLPLISGSKERVPVPLYCHCRVSERGKNEQSLYLPST